MEWRNVVGVLDKTRQPRCELSVHHELKWARLNGSVFFSSHIQLPGCKLRPIPQDPLDLQRTDSQSLMPGVSEAKTDGD